ncbi:cell division protein ZapE [Rhodococcus sp. OK519]|uniref:cell division protein ZapE n=1 Tax=Rhodococcus sp. OK519 TaxID=2135729 RepID=UPI000D3482CF|nr:cell division protein ZapE [Rhodococcus sp. OK519]
MRWPWRVSHPDLSVPAAAFDRAAQTQGFTIDHAQQQAISRLQNTSGRGTYLWGPVGRGKSWLMATYFAALPTEHKRRVHFHEFFRELHTAIRRHHNDLDAALDSILDGVHVLCFDEFHLHDIADAKFVERLLPDLFDRHVALVVTSNYPPHRLLPNPLFHESFTPTIELIEQSLEIVEVDGQQDYRTESRHVSGFASGRWMTPGDADQLAGLGLEHPGPDELRTLTPCGHPLVALRAEAHCLWFDFRDLCEHTTAPADYLALASRYDRWTLSGIPDLAHAGREPTQRFANLVDVLYDKDVPAVFLAECSLDSLTTAETPPADIDRILSRLRQLQPVPTA